MSNAVPARDAELMDVAALEAVMPGPRLRDGSR